MLGEKHLDPHSTPTKSVALAPKQSIFKQALPDDAFMCAQVREVLVQKISSQLAHLGRVSICYLPDVH